MDINIGKILIQPKDTWISTQAYEYQNLFITQENLYRIGQMENKIQNTLDTALQTEEALKQYSKGSAVPFGRFYVAQDGCLKLAIYGDYTPDNIFIDDNGNLILPRRSRQNSRIHNQPSRLICHNLVAIQLA